MKHDYVGMMQIHFWAAIGHLKQSCQVVTFQGCKLMQVIRMFREQFWNCSYILFWREFCGCKANAG